jgi:hypothetical protein
LDDDEEEGDDTTLLLGTERSHSTPRVKGTSASKAFFMLSKAFVGTGVLFLPVLYSPNI